MRSAFLQTLNDIHVTRLTRKSEPHDSDVSRQTDRPRYEWKLREMTTTIVNPGRPMVPTTSTLTAMLWPALVIWCAILSDVICCAALSAKAPYLAAEARTLAETNAVKVYAVNRKVADFPDTEDMSMPEAACATLNRLLARSAPVQREIGFPLVFVFEPNRQPKYR